MALAAVIVVDDDDGGGDFIFLVFIDSFIVSCWRTLAIFGFGASTKYSNENQNEIFVRGWSVENETKNESH